MKKNHCLDHLDMKPSPYSMNQILLSKSRSIFIDEVFTKEMAAVVTGLLFYYDNQSQTEDITLYINSNGGDGDALLQIYDAVKMISAPVSTVCVGKAYSAGAYLLSFGSKGKRKAFKHSLIMIHGVQFKFPLLGESVDTNDSFYHFVETANNSILKILVDHTGHSLEKVKEDCKYDTYLNAEQALKYGIIDVII
jgi:ATP-dependent Clp protease protease subunit